MRARARLNIRAWLRTWCARSSGGGSPASPSGSGGGDAADGPTAAANYNNLIDPDAADPISGTVALRSYLCQIRRLEHTPA